MSFVFEEKTKLLLRGLFDVQNDVGLGRQEEDYHRAFILWLNENQIPFVSKPPHPVMLDNKVVHTLYPDFVVWSSIVVELKAAPRRLGNSEYAQLFDYLKCRGSLLGLLANMGPNRVHVQRIIYEPEEPQLKEKWDFWTDDMEGPDREVGVAVSDALRAVYDAQGTGYGQEVLRKLVLFALRRRNLSVVESPVAKAYFHDILLHESPLDCYLVEGRVPLLLTALLDGNEFNVQRGKSYLKALGLCWGIAANFGKKRAEFTGLCRSA